MQLFNSTNDNKYYTKNKARHLKSTNRPKDSISDDRRLFSEEIIDIMPQFNSQYVMFLQVFIPVLQDINEKKNSTIYTRIIRKLMEKCPLYYTSPKKVKFITFHMAPNTFSLACSGNQLLLLTNKFMSGDDTVQ